MSETVRVLDSGGVIMVALNRPEHRNALTRQMLQAISAGLGRAERSPSACMLVLRAEGHDFCTGLDLDEFYGSAEESAAEHSDEARLIAGILRGLHQLPVPTVAVVQGRALGLGATLAAACDVVLASSAMSMGFPEVSFGFVPAFAAVVLREQLGPKVAFELLATGRTVKAEEARMLGLVSRVIPEEGFAAVTGSCLQQLTSAAPEQVIELKRLLTSVQGRSFDEALALSEAANARARASAAFRQAAREFAEMS